MPVLSLDSFNFHQVHLCFLCQSALLSADRESILQSGAYLIDCVGILDGAPCLIASLNPKSRPKEHLITNPTAATIALAHVLAPIHKAFQIINAEATLLLSANLFGAPAIQDLLIQSRCLFTRTEPEGHFFPKIQAFNLIPDISPALNRKTADQIKSLLGFPISVSSCLTPVFQGEAYSLTFTTDKKASLSRIREICANSCCVDNAFAPDLGLTTQDILLGDSICVSRLSAVPFRPSTYHLWLLCDSLRMGAIPNAVQVAEYLLG